MATGLVLAADASTPPTYSKLPRGVKVVLGYVGLPGCTPHIWTHAEAQTARRHGYTWCPIVTVPESGLSAADGREAAAHAATVLPGYRHPSGLPVFLDVEQHALDDDLAGARACVSEWTARMHAAGYLRAYAYCDPAAGGAWLPDWTGERPKSLPSRLVGWQYEGPERHPEYDLSVFRADLFTGTHPAPAPAKAKTERPDTYTVRKGDTLSGIGRRFGVPWQSIYAANRQVIGADPDLIKPGQRLVIGEAGPVRTYTVRRGDSLTSIARRYSTNWQSIYSLNRKLIGPDPDLILPGQVLRVP